MCLSPYCGPLWRNLCNGSCPFFSAQKEGVRPDGRNLSEFRQTTLNVGKFSKPTLRRLWICESFFTAKSSAGMHPPSYHDIGFLDWTTTLRRWRYNFETFSRYPLISGSISTAEGSALVKLGNTTAVCGVKIVRIYTLSSTCPRGRAYQGDCKMHGAKLTATQGWGNFMRQSPLVRFSPSQQKINPWCGWHPRFNTVAKSPHPSSLILEQSLELLLPRDKRPIQSHLMPLTHSPGGPGGDPWG